MLFPVLPRPPWQANDGRKPHLTNCTGGPGGVSRGSWRGAQGVPQDRPGRPPGLSALASWLCCDCSAARTAGPRGLLERVSVPHCRRRLART
jgi:hypothetical protein